MGEVLGLLFNTAVFAAALRMATPLIFAALGGIFSERSGVVNIALEGMMLIGAFTAMFVSYQTGLPWMGVLGAVLAGILIGLLHAVFCIHYRANQVVIGTAINIFAGGITVFLLRYYFGAAGTSPSVSTISDIPIPLVSLDGPNCRAAKSLGVLGVSRSCRVSYRDLSNALGFEAQGGGRAP